MAGWPQHCANLTGRAFGECFWNLDKDAVVRWPSVLIPRCEVIFGISPYIAEFFSTVTALLFVYLGLVQLLCSGYSDEVVDLAATVFLINGVSAALSHGSHVRFWGQMDSITINVMALIFSYAVLQLYFPSVNMRRFTRAAILVIIMLLITCTSARARAYTTPPGQRLSTARTARHAPPLT